MEATLCRFDEFLCQCVTEIWNPLLFGLRAVRLSFVLLIPILFPVGPIFLLWPPLVMLGNAALFRESRNLFIEIVLLIQKKE
jgi:hypothetical protein